MLDNLKTKGLKLKCPRCGWIWEYKGLHNMYATCPNCYTKVRVKEVEKRG